jgi:putative ABC transport system permease protein
MRRVLLFISLRSWRSHKLRIAITILSVCIAVATFVALQTVNQSLEHSLEATVDKLAGKATLQITAGEAGFPEEVLDTVRSTPGVTDATGVIQIFCRTTEDFRDWQDLLIFGIDPESFQKLRPPATDLSPPAPATATDASAPAPINPLEFLRLPDTIAVSAAVAKERGLDAGQALPVYTPQGKVDLTILAVFDDKSLASLNRGRVGIMEIHSAQNLFARGKTVDRIDLVTAPRVPVESVRESLKARLTSGLDVERPQQRAREVEDAIGIVRRGFLLTSLIAMLISAFLIFNAMAIAVNQRWKEIGILRAVGAGRNSVRNMFLYEAGVIGVIGSGLGIVAGYYMAVVSGRIMASVTTAVSTGIYSLIVEVAAPERPQFNPVFAVEAVAMGVIASVVSTWLPARTAAKVDPIMALHNIETRRRESIVGWPRMAVGFVLIAAGLGLIRFTSAEMGVLIQLSYDAFIFAGMVLMLPGLSCWIAKALRPVADRFMGSSGALAVDSIILAPRRTSATVGAIMTGVAFAYSGFAFIQGERAAVVGSFERGTACDLRVWGGSSIPEQIASRIAAVPGVQQVDRLSGGPIRYKGQTVLLYASDMAVRFSQPGGGLSAGDTTRAAEMASRGEGLLVSNVFAARWRVGVGDTLSLDAPTAHLDLPVVGVVERSGQAWLEGVIYVDRALYKRYWDNPRIGGLDVYLKPGADPAAIRDEIQGLASTGQLLFIMTGDELKAFIKGNVERNADVLFKFFYAQMLIAGFVAAIGIVNTLVISVWDRRQEIGIIRAVGGTRGQIARMIIFEATALGALGLATAAIKGLFDTYFMSRTVAGVFGGYSIPFHFPALLMLWSIPAVVAVVLAAAWWPARIAARTNVVAAIGAE